MLVVKDFATTFLAAPIADADDSIVVEDAGRLPFLAEGDYFFLVLQKFDNRDYVETVMVTGASGNVLSVVRAQDGTSRKIFSAGDYAEVRLTTRSFSELVEQFGIKNIDLHNHNPSAHPELSAAIEADADRAEVAATAAMMSADVYADVPSGLAATPDGQFFSVLSSDVNEYVHLYKNVGNVAVLQKTYPSDKKVASLDEELGYRMEDDDSDFAMQLVDSDGNVAFSVKEDEIHTKELSLTRNGVVFGAQSIISTDELAFAVIDEEGFFSVCIDKEGDLISAKSASDCIAVGEHLLTSASDLSFGVIDDEGFYGVYVDNVGNSITVESSSTSTFQADEIAKLNTEGLRSLSVTDGTFNTEVARPVWDYNHFLMYGQSLSTGQEGWPALSKIARHGNLMLGGATRPVSGSAAEFTPIGASTLQPLISVVQRGASVLTDAQVAALAAGDQALGEDPLVGMVNFAKLQHNQRLFVSNDTSRVFVASSAGVSGTTIEQLSAGASPNMFLRLVQAAEKVKSIATASGKSYGIVAVVFLQGEYNYDESFGGDTTKDGYKAKLSKLYDDIEAQVKTAISGQAEPPIFITYQTGAQYTRDDKGLAIGMAQLELSRERRNWYLASPAYPYTDKGGHMDSNGYRWLSKQFGKVWARVVEQGRSWKPLSPIVAQVRSDEVLVSFHVPSPPLAFDNPYANSAAVSYPNKGFEVLVNGVSVGITSVQIVADTVVRIRLATSATGVVEIRYAGKTAHQGNGSLRDSDQTVADDVYTYAAGTGQYPAANIPSLVDKPYPLHNWCVAFQITATPT